VTQPKLFAQVLGGSSLHCNVDDKGEGFVGYEQM